MRARPGRRGCWRWAVGPLPRPVAPEELEVPEDLREAWAARVAIMTVDGGVPRAAAERWAWAGLQVPGEER
jgi:hypothetical protein